MAAIPKLPSNIIRSLSEIIGDTDIGLTGSEIGRVLSDCNIADPSPGVTKKHRLCEALNQKQETDNCANHVLNFVKTVMSPVRYRSNPALFTDRLSQINEVLLFSGLTISEDGSLKQVNAATTLSEAQERAGRLRKKLLERDVHVDVLKFCKSELQQENYFHAVFEAIKSVADKIRDKTGLALDGSEIVDRAFGLGPNNNPKLAFNTLRTDSEQSEHKGFANLLRGMFGMFRNVTAHVPKIKWSINEQDALDSLTLASLLHRKLDKCVPTGI